MSIYSDPPAARTFRSDKATLLVCWWCTIFAAVIIMFRVCGRYIRTEKLFKEDVLAFTCIIPLFIRMAFVHIVLLYGTNNTTTTGFSAHEIYRRSIGSRFVLISRIFYAATLWMLKLTIIEFFKRLTFNIWTKSHERMLNFIKYFLLATFVGVIIADLAECQPYAHYWQVVPDPGAKCRQGYSHLLMMGVADVFSDILLVVFPIPIIITSKMGVKRKIQLVILFAGSLIPAGITLYRIPNVIQRDGSQQYRSLLASIELLFATAVANVLVLGSFVRDRGVKKQRWKFGSMSDSIERTTSRRGTVIRHWGSDEDLVRDMGISANPELRDEMPVPRPAPMAASQKLMSKDWEFERSQASEESDMIGEVHSIQESTMSSMSPRKVSFFDVGGLLDDDIDTGSTIRRGSSLQTVDTDAESSLRKVHSNYSNEMGLSPTPARRGSHAILQDIGGLLGPRRVDRHSGTRGYELQTITQERSPHLAPVSSSSLTRQKTNHSLQDVGGLLN